MEEGDITAIMANIQNLCEDVSSNGGWLFENTEFRYHPDEGFGIFTTSELPPGLPIIKVPYNLCLSVDMVACDYKLAKVLKENPGLFSYPDEILAIAIMYSKNPTNSCEWTNHVNTFPLHMNSTMFWKDEELEELKYCNVYHLTKMINRQMQQDWDSIHVPLIAEFPFLAHHTFELYKWALSMVYSRAVGLTRNKKYIRCIPPIIDMANHSPNVGHDSSDTFDFQEDENMVSLYNTVPRAAGEQCFASYGYYSNAKLAHTYGFILVDNPVRAVDLWTRTSPATVLKDEKDALLNSIESTRDQTYDFTGTIRPNWISPALLLTIRIIQCDESELSVLKQKVLNKSKNLMVSIRNELATYNSLRGLVVAKMKAELAEVCIRILIMLV